MKHDKLTFFYNPEENVVPFKDSSEQTRLKIDRQVFDR